MSSWFESISRPLQCSVCLLMNVMLSLESTAFSEKRDGEGSEDFNIETDRLNMFQWAARMKHILQNPFFLLIIAEVILSSRTNHVSFHETIYICTVTHCGICLLNEMSVGQVGYHQIFIDQWHKPFQCSYWYTHHSVQKKRRHGLKRCEKISVILFVFFKK